MTLRKIISICIFATRLFDENRVENYERALDLRTAVASVSYDFEGVHYRREYFTSHPANVLVIRLTADRKGKISFRAGLESCMSGTPDLSARENGSITLRNILPGNGLKTEAVLKVLPDGGELYTDGTTVSVSGADTATVILSCGTDYKMELPSFRGEDPHEAVTERVEKAAGRIAADGYEALKKEHTEDHSRLFSRTELGFRRRSRRSPQTSSSRNTAT